MADVACDWFEQVAKRNNLSLRGVREAYALVLTMCYNVDISQNVSVRLEERLADRIRLRARAAGETMSDRLRRYAEEGVRRDEHPLVTFRDGPTGRRAGLIGGPDVWEVVMWVKDLSGEPDPVETLSTESGLSRSQIEAAFRYLDSYPDEVEARVELHRRESAPGS
jgi:hypothetical protein